MKLNHECVRYLLLYIEEESTFDHTINLTNVKLSNYDKDTILYTGQKLVEANFINGKPFYAGNSIYHFPVSSITWDGHQFLDNVRDDFVWEEAKSKTSSFKSTSLNILSGIASQIIATIIEKQMGM